MSDKKQVRLTSPIPNDTREALKLHNWQIDNIALLLNKYLDFCIIENNHTVRELIEPNKVKQINFLPILKNDKVFYTGLKKIFEYNKKKNRYKIIGKDFEKNYVRNLKTNFKNYRDNLLNWLKEEKNSGKKGKIKELLNKVIERQIKIADKKFELTTQTRLVVGLGSGSVLETSIKLHHIYGVPYIPASAIKGVLRAYRIWELAKCDIYKFLIVEEIVENYENNKFEEIKNNLAEKIVNDKFNKKLKEIDKDLSEEDLKNIKNNLLEYLENVEKEKIEKIVDIFGNKQQKGKLIVLDAYPTDFEGFDIDIMNPHFPDYYDKDKAPADWQNPNPITFLAIPKGTIFNFFFKNVDVYNGNLKEDLKEAFENIGIGAKTSIGYGILE